MDIQGYLETVRLLPREQQPSDQKRGDHADPHTQSLSVSLMLLSLGFMYSVHNLIAPNMTAIAKRFHFNDYERDTYIGGELTLFFYFPGVFGALFAGILSGMVERRLLLALLAIITGIACLCTARVATFTGLAWARALTGFSIGGSLPVVYSLVGDWFPAKKRATATAFVSAASGAGVFFGQCIATLAGASDWRWPFVVVMLPCVATGIMIWFLAEEPTRGGKEDGIEMLSLYKNSGIHYAPGLNVRHLRAFMQNRTNLLVILQAFPGNIPWGVIIVYIHDFLVQDLGLSTHSALGAITTLAASAFVGIFTGGFVGESLYGANSRYLAIFGGISNILRAVPFFILFGWKRLVGPVEQSSETAFYVLLMFGGFMATMASPCTGAMLLNVNLPEMRGSIMAMYSVLDDLAKGFGTFFIAMIVRLVGGRAVAYQLSLLIWIFTGVALLYTWYTYEADEQLMRQHLDEAALESMVLVSKQRAQQAIRDRAKAAGEAHFAQRSLGVRSEEIANMRWNKNPDNAASWGRGLGMAAETANAVSSVSKNDAKQSQGSQSSASGDPHAKGANTAEASWRWGAKSSSGRAARCQNGERERLHRAAQAAAEAMTGKRGP